MRSAQKASSGYPPPSLLEAQRKKSDSRPGRTGRLNPLQPPHRYGPSPPPWFLVLPMNQLESLGQCSSLSWLLPAIADGHPSVSCSTNPMTSFLKRVAAQRERLAGHGTVRDWPSLKSGNNPGSRMGTVSWAGMPAPSPKADPSGGPASRGCRAANDSLCHSVLL